MISQQLRLGNPWRSIPTLRTKYGGEYTPIQAKVHVSGPNNLSLLGGVLMGDTSAAHVLAMVPKLKRIDVAAFEVLAAKVKVTHI